MGGERAYGNRRIVTTRAVTVKAWVLRSIVPEMLLTPVANLVPLTVDGSRCVVNSLVMKWDAKLSIVHLRHLRLGAWSSGQIRVSSDRGKVRGPRGEIMLWKWGDASMDAASVVLRSAMVRVMSTGVEGPVGVGTVNTWNALLRTGGLPVDWLHAVFELVRRLELPLADKCPDHRDSSN